MARLSSPPDKTKETSLTMDSTRFGSIRTKANPSVRPSVVLFSPASTPPPPIPTSLTHPIPPHPSASSLFFFHTNTHRPFALRRRSSSTKGEVATGAPIQRWMRTLVKTNIEKGGRAADESLFACDNFCLRKKNKRKKKARASGTLRSLSLKISHHKNKSAEPSTNSQMSKAKRAPLQQRAAIFMCGS